MAIVFFLFQLLNMAKASWNNYQTNAFVQDTEALPDCSSVYQAGQQMSGENDENWMVCIAPPLSVLEEMRMVRLANFFVTGDFT